MAQDLMNYEQMTQLALRGVVRDAIRRVIREDGLPGAHHFYITFLTRFPGAEVDEGLAKKYPEEITIVIEHQFWDLAANDEDFEVTLKFGGVPKYLKVPYTAVTRFHDPSVGFALQFEPPQEMQPQPEPATLARIDPAPALAPVAETKPTPKPKPAKKSKIRKKKAETATEETAEADTPKEDDTKVVSLDAFRKK